MSRYARNYQANQGSSKPEELEKVVAEQLKITASKLQGTFVILIAFPKDAPPEVVFSPPSALQSVLSKKYE